MRREAETTWLLDREVHILRERLRTFLGRAGGGEEGN